MDTQQVLDQIFSQKTVTLSDGRNVALKKVTVRTLKPVIDLLSRAMADLKLSGEEVAGQMLGADPSLILKLISKYYDETVELSSLLSDVPLEDVYELGADDGLTLAQGIIVLNQDFFTKSVLPTLGLGQAARAMASGSAKVSETESTS